MLYNSEMLEMQFMIYLPQGLLQHTWYQLSTTHNYLYTFANYPMNCCLLCPLPKDMSCQQEPNLWKLIPCTCLPWSAVQKCPCCQWTQKLPQPSCLQHCSMNNMHRWWNWF